MDDVSCLDAPFGGAPHHTAALHALDRERYAEPTYRSPHLTSPSMHFQAPFNHPSAVPLHSHHCHTHPRHSMHPHYENHIIPSSTGQTHFPSVLHAERRSSGLSLPYELEFDYSATPSHFSASAPLFASVQSSSNGPSTSSVSSFAHNQVLMPDRESTKDPFPSSMMDEDFFLLHEDLGAVESSGLMQKIDSVWLQAQTVGQLEPRVRNVHLGALSIEALHSLVSLLNRLRASRAARQTPRTAFTSSSATLSSSAMNSVSNNPSLSTAYSSNVNGHGFKEIALHHPESEVAPQNASTIYSFLALSASSSSSHQHHSNSNSSSSSSVNPHSVPQQLLLSSTFPPPTSCSSSYPVLKDSEMHNDLKSSKRSGDRHQSSHSHSHSFFTSHSHSSSHSSGEPRFCTPSRLITVYSSKPFLITPIYLEKQYLSSRKALESMTMAERGTLCTVSVRFMGHAVENELFLVATDVCALLAVRKSNTAKALSSFSSIVSPSTTLEKAAMPVSCLHSTKGTSTHILSVLTLAGVSRLTAASRAILAPSVAHFLLSLARRLIKQSDFVVPIFDPLKPTITMQTAHLNPDSLFGSSSSSSSSSISTHENDNDEHDQAYEEPVNAPPRSRRRSRSPTRLTSETRSKKMARSHVDTDAKQERVKLEH